MMQTIELDLRMSEFLKLAMLAHQQDITLNQLINNLLQSVVDKHEETFKTAGFDNVY
jgi:hypothetical protein